MATRGVELRGKRYSVLGMFDLEGCIHYRAVEGSIKTDTFYDMLLEDVARQPSPAHHHPRPLMRARVPTQIPLMSPYPERRSVLVLDNCATHRREAVVAAVDAIGAIVEFLPPYAADVAVHEQGIRSAKDYLRHQAHELPNDNMLAIDLAMRQVTAAHMRSAFLRCGYPNVY